MTELEWTKQFGFNLKSIMNEWGINQEQLAFEVGVDRTTINRYLNGRCMPTIKSIINLADVFECSTDDLINFDERIE